MGTRNVSRRRDGIIIAGMIFAWPAGRAALRRVATRSLVTKRRVAARTRHRHAIVTLPNALGPSRSFSFIHTDATVISRVYRCTRRPRRPVATTVNVPYSGGRNRSENTRKSSSAPLRRLLYLDPKRRRHHACRLKHSDILSPLDPNRPRFSGKSLLHSTSSSWTKLHPLARHPSEFFPSFIKTRNVSTTFLPIPSHFAFAKVRVSSELEFQRRDDGVIPRVGNSTILSWHCVVRRLRRFENDYIRN